MRLLIAAIGLLFVLCGTASARCAGKDLFADLQATDPAAAEALLAQARGVPNGEGRFWRIEKAGVEPSYVFGTFHVSDAVEAAPPAVWDALDTARVGVFEVTLDDESGLQQRMAREPAFVLDPEAPPFAERMNADDLTLVTELFRARGIAVEVAEKLKPWMQLSLVTFPPCQIMEIEAGAEMLDAVLASHGTARGIPEIGLEKVVDALESFSDLSRDDQTRILIGAGRSMAIEEDVYATNLRLYADGRIALIEIFSNWLADRHMPDLGLHDVNNRLLERLLDGRNARWLPKLLEEVGRGNAFVAVGALHLVGERGLIAALEREGYTATRLD